MTWILGQLPDIKLWCPEYDQKFRSCSRHSISHEIDVRNSARDGRNNASDVRNRSSDVRNMTQNPGQFAMSGPWPGILVIFWTLKCDVREKTWFLVIFQTSLALFQTFLALFRTSLAPFLTSLALFQTLFYLKTGCPEHDQDFWSYSGHQLAEHWH